MLLHTWRMYSSYSGQFISDGAIKAAVTCLARGTAATLEQGGRTSKASVPCWYYSKLRAAVKFQLIICFHSSPESHDQHARQQRRIQCGVRNGLLASCSCACKTGGAGRMEQHLLDCRDETRERVRESCARPGRVYSWLFWLPLADRPLQGGGSIT